MSREADCGAVDWEAAALAPALWQQTLQAYVVEHNMPPHPAVLARAVAAEQGR
jgi:4-amino-4-deoxy-L-arabinose transferase-like glycosyltransferase